MFGRPCQAVFLIALFTTSLGLGMVESSVRFDEPDPVLRTGVGT